MQRLSSWFEQLSLRRREYFQRPGNCDLWSHSHKRQSKPAAPRFHYSITSIPNNHCHDRSANVLSQSLDVSNHEITPSSWNRQETETHLCDDSCKVPAPFLQSTIYGRKNIRTNPWISRSRQLIQTTADPVPKSYDKLSVDRATSFRINSLDESIYSSGYGSQDSSPESSVHSPDWQSSVKTKRCRLADKAVECNLIDVDEALGLDLVCKSKMEDPRRADVRNPFYQDDEHVYYELEAFDQLTLLLDDCTCLSDSEIVSLSDELLHYSRCSSPIYAKTNYDYRSLRYCPSDCEKCAEDLVTEYPNVASSFTYIPCTSCRPPPEFHPPLPPTVPQHLQANDREQAELGFLTELDAQIAELQMKGAEVRQLVDEARERRDSRVRNAQLYHDLTELKRTKLVLRNHFELAL